MSGSVEETNHYNFSEIRSIDGLPDEDDEDGSKKTNKPAMIPAPQIS